MDPISIAMYALKYGGALAGLFGRKSNNISTDFLNKHFGAGAVNDELQQLFNQAIRSPQGQQLMASANESGQQFQSDLAKSSAAAGLGPAGGATGGADLFASAGAGQAANNLQRSAKSSLMQSMLPIAQQMVQSRMAAYLQGRNMQSQVPFLPTNFSQLGDMVSGAATTGINALPNGASPTDTASQILTNAGRVGTFPDSAAPPTAPRFSPTASALSNINIAPTGAPSMRDVQQQVQTTQGRTPRANRFSGSMSSAVQPMN